MASKKTTKKAETPIDQHETFVSLQKSFADSQLSVEEKLRVLYELQKADSEIDNIIQLRGELPAEVEALEEEISGMKVRSAEISALIEQLNRNIADAKLSIAEHDSTIEKYQRQLETIANSREYDSLNKEIENQELLRQIDEKNITDTRAEIGALKADLDDLKDRLSIRTDDLKIKKAELETIVESTAKEEAVLRERREKYAAQMDAFQPHLALEEIFKLIQRANKYIDETAPWILAKDEAKKTRLATVMYNLLEALRVSLIMLTPFIPESCEKAFAQIGADESLRTWDSALTYGALPNDAEVHKGETLFPRIDAAKMLEELEKAEQAAKGPKVKINPVLPDVSIDEFAKCDMRVCKVLSCEAVKKSEKLLKFQLDDGSGTPRQILSGIHKFYEPEDLVGKTVVAILNLPPRKMMGQMSNGMLLSALREVDGKEELHLLILDDSVPAGAQLC